MNFAEKKPYANTVVKSKKFPDTIAVKTENMNNKVITIKSVIVHIRANKCCCAKWFG